MIKRLSKLREYRANLDPLKYLSTEHRQNLLAIQESFRQLNLVNYIRSSLCDTFTTTASAYVSITNLNLEITTHGSPVLLGIALDYGTSGIVSAANCSIKITRKVGLNAEENVTIFPIVGNASVQNCGFTYLDVVDANKYTYDAKLMASNATVTNLRLFAYELK